MADPSLTDFHFRVRWSDAASREHESWWSERGAEGWSREKMCFHAGFLLGHAQPSDSAGCVILDFEVEERWVGPPGEEPESLEAPTGEIDPVRAAREVERLAELLATKHAQAVTAAHRFNAQARRFNRRGQDTLAEEAAMRSFAARETAHALQAIGEDFRGLEPGTLAPPDVDTEAPGGQPEGRDAEEGLVDVG